MKKQEEKINFILKKMDEMYPPKETEIILDN